MNVPGFQDLLEAPSTALSGPAGGQLVFYPTWPCWRPLLALASPFGLCCLLGVTPAPHTGKVQQQQKQLLEKFFKSETLELTPAQRCGAVQTVLKKRPPSGGVLTRPVVAVLDIFGNAARAHAGINPALLDIFGNAARAHAGFITPDTIELEGTNSMTPLNGRPAIAINHASPIPHPPNDPNIFPIVGTKSKIGTKSKKTGVAVDGRRQRRLRHAHGDARARSRSRSRSPHRDADKESAKLSRLDLSGRGFRDAGRSRRLPRPFSCPVQIGVGLSCPSRSFSYPVQMDFLELSATGGVNFGE